ncbi:MAG: hypothetical protein KDA57_23280, partial [Planctomycetales bacterium]|nr:hypothetical protein [Planctomycetales bacterium]
MTYHQCIAASWLGMAVSMLFSHADTTWAETKAELTLESPRRAFYRGEVVLIVVKVANIGESSLADSVLNLKLAECVERTSATFQLARGEERRLSFRLPTAAIRSGVYKLNCTLMSKNLAAAAELTEPIIIGSQPKPDQMLIWLWGGSGNQW